MRFCVRLCLCGLLDQEFKHLDQGNDSYFLKILLNTLYGFLDQELIVSVLEMAAQNNFENWKIDPMQNILGLIKKAYDEGYDLNDIIKGYDKDSIIYDILVTAMREKEKSLAIGFKRCRQT